MSLCAWDRGFFEGENLYRPVNCLLVKYVVSW
jgi:hypothetical protein